MHSSVLSAAFAVINLARVFTNSTLREDFIMPGLYAARNIAARIVFGGIAVVFATGFAAVTLAAEIVPTAGHGEVLWPDGKLPKLTTSRVVGSPDPPLPYTT